MEQPSRKPRRRRHSKSQREAILEEYRQSSLKQDDFAKEKGISSSTLQRWLQLSKLSSCREEPTGDLIPVRLVSQAPPSRNPSTSSPFEIVLAAGRILRVPPGFDPEEVRLLLKFLEAPC